MKIDFSICDQFFSRRSGDRIKPEAVSAPGHAPAGKEKPQSGRPKAIGSAMPITNASLSVASELGKSGPTEWAAFHRMLETDTYRNWTTILQATPHAIVLGSMVGNTAFFRINARIGKRTYHKIQQLRIRSPKRDTKNALRSHQARCIYVNGVAYPSPGSRVFERTLGKAPRKNKGDILLFTPVFAKQEANA